MGKSKLGLSSFLFKLRDSPKPSCYFSSPSPCSAASSSSSSWPWPSCNIPKTSSFRAGAADGGAGGADAIYKTVNSVYFEYSNDSCFTHSSAEEQESFSTVSEESEETVVRRLCSDRLFFEPGDTSSILQEPAKASTAKEESEAAADSSSSSPFEDSVALALESEDPYTDFRRSMEEMVAVHGIKEWERLEELLLWYLRVNGKTTHGFIVGAFVDLLLDLASSSSSSPLPSSSSSNSFQIEELPEEDSSKPSHKSPSLSREQNNVH